MTQEVDLETVLRALHAVSPKGAHASLNATLWLNPEGRIVLRPTNAVDAPEYVVFGNNVAQYPAPKPSTQRAVAQGFDAHKGMGDQP